MTFSIEAKEKLLTIWSQPLTLGTPNQQEAVIGDLPHLQLSAPVVHSNNKQSGGKLKFEHMSV